MLNGQKPWAKNLFENFLLILSVLAITLTRIVGKIINGQFGMSNFIALLFAVVGLVLLIVSKLDNLKKGNCFSFGSREMSVRNRAISRLAYGAMIIGLLLSFLL